MRGLRAACSRVGTQMHWRLSPFPSPRLVPGSSQRCIPGCRSSGPFQQQQVVNLGQTASAASFCSSGLPRAQGPRLAGSGRKLWARTIAESCFCLLPECSDSESQEEVIQNIARRLAQVGDEMDHSIQPTLVRQLAAQFRNASLSEEVSM